MAEFVFDVPNGKAFAQAAKLAPGRVFGSVRREFQRGGKAWQKIAIQEWLQGGKGIYLPSRAKRATERSAKKVVAASSKRFFTKQRKQTQQAHILFKSGGMTRTVFLVGYLSKFLTYHAPPIDLEPSFRAQIPAMQARIQKATVSITQAVLDKALRDRAR